MKSKVLLLIALFLVSLTYVNAQDDDLMSLLELQEEERTDYTIATFKSFRIINGHSIETLGHGNMNFVIGHRFGRINGGIKELFGIDNATIRFEFAYGITDRFTVGIGRSSFEKTYDGYLKYKLLRQSTGAKKFPFALTLFSGIAVRTLDFPNPERENYFSSRLFFTYQAMIARKFTKNFSAQITPTVIHRNLVPTIEDANTIFGIGIGGRYKVTGSISLNAEYYYVLPNQIVSPVYGESVHNSLAVGIDIETGGHVFQIMLTNSRGMVDKSFISETTGTISDGDIHLGFNINRVFSVYNPSKRGERKTGKAREKATGNSE